MGITSLNLHFAGIEFGTGYSSVKDSQALSGAGGVVSTVLLDGFLVNELSHQVAQLKVRKFFTTDLNGFASFGITSRVRFILFHFKAAKATDLNPSTFG